MQENTEQDSLKFVPALGRGRKLTKTRSGMKLSNTFPLLLERTLIYLYIAIILAISLD